MDFLKTDYFESKLQNIYPKVTCIFCNEGFSRPDFHHLDISQKKPDKDRPRGKIDCIETSQVLRRVLYLTDWKKSIFVFKFFESKASNGSSWHGRKSEMCRKCQPEVEEKIGPRSPVWPKADQSRRLGADRCSAVRSFFGMLQYGLFESLFGFSGGTGVLTHSSHKLYLQQHSPSDLTNHPKPPQKRLFYLKKGKKPFKKLRFQKRKTSKRFLFSFFFSKRFRLFAPKEKPPSRLLGRAKRWPRSSNGPIWPWIACRKTTVCFVFFFSKKVFFRFFPFFLKQSGLLSLLSLVTENCEGGDCNFNVDFIFANLGGVFMWSFLVQKRFLL